MMNKMMGININCKYHDFIRWILDGIKTIETRDNPNSLKPYIGKRIGLVMTGRGRAKLVGYATITGYKEYKTYEEFHSDDDKHLVLKGNRFDFKKVKYGFFLSDIEICEPKEIYTKGIIARAI